MAYNHSVALACDGHAVTVFTPAYEGDARTEAREGFTIEWLKPVLAYGNAGFTPQLARRLADFDVIHLHYPCYGMAEVVWWAKLRNPALKLVVTYHMDVVGGIILRPLFWLHTKLLMPRIIRIADRVIVTSNDYAAHSKISKLFYSIPNKFIDIPPEVNTHHFFPRPAHSKIRERHGLANGERMILFVGGLDKAHYFKGIEFLIESFQVVQRSTKHQMKLVIVGEGDMRPAYERRVRALGLDEQIIFAGSVSYDELPEYYSAADVTVLPSIDASEAFGIVLIESLACGTPVIASRLPGVRTAFQEGVDGLSFTVRNEGQFAAAIAELLDHDVVRERMGAAGLMHARSTYAQEKVYTRLKDVYESLR